MMSLINFTIKIPMVVMVPAKIKGKLKSRKGKPLKSASPQLEASLGRPLQG